SLLSMLFGRPASAGSATWKSSPASGDWNKPINWTPGTVPNGASDTATFGASSITDVFLSAVTTVDGIVFSPGASSYSIDLSAGGNELSIVGTGISNNSGTTENFLLPNDPTFGAAI